MKLSSKIFKFFKRISLFFRKIFVIFIKILLVIYKNTFSPLLKYLFNGGCRFKPTCSEYSVVVIEKYGIIKGSLLSFKRILSCNNFLK